MFEKLVKTTWRSAGRQSFKAGKEQSGCLLASAVEAAARKSNLIFAQHSGVEWWNSVADTENSNNWQESLLEVIRQNFAV